MRNQLLTIPGVTACNSQDKYLGLPTYVGRRKYGSFEYIKEKVWAKFNNWKNTHLSQVGNEVLVKAVVQTVPTYAMSLFLFSKKLCKDIAALMSRFWWSFGNQDKRI